MGCGGEANGRPERFGLRHRCKLAKSPYPRHTGPGPSGRGEGGTAFRPGNAEAGTPDAIRGSACFSAGRVRLSDHLNLSDRGPGRRAAILVATLGALALAGCRPAPRASAARPLTAGRETVITEAEIARLSVRTAWDVVRLRAPRLIFGQDAQGNPSQVRIQAPRSVNADETPLLVVDGMRMGDLGYLTEIPASTIHAMRILDSESAEPLYGLPAAGGAIVVETKNGS